MPGTWKDSAVSKRRRVGRVLVDTGPLVAILSEDDAQHVVCTEALKQIEPPLLTCWPVLTEAAWLLRTDSKAMIRLLQGVEVGFFQLLDVEPKELAEIEQLYQRYRDLSPQLADMTLVHRAQLYREHR